jgi:hypothetical protein
MNQSLDQRDCQRTRAAGALDITVLALKQGATHMAFAAAWEAARLALLACGGAPHRLAGSDLDMLRQMAASSPQQLAGRPTERQAKIRAVLAILDRLFLQPEAREVWVSPAPPGSASPASPVPAHARCSGRYVALPSYSIHAVGSKECGWSSCGRSRQPSSS